MTLTHENVAAIVGAVIAVLLQVIVAPALSLFAAIPNFIVAFCVVRAVVCPQYTGAVLPFVLGLLFDLIGGGPVGGMALVLVLVTFASSRAYMALNNDTLFMPMAIMLCSIVVVEFAYGTIVVACGAGVSFGDAMLYRALPCLLYDCVIALVFYPIATRVLVGKPLGQPGTPILR